MKIKKEMKKIRTLLVGLLVLGIMAPSMAQDKRVKVDQKVKVKVDPDVRVEVDPDFDLDIDTDIDFDLDADFVAEIEAFAENTARDVLSGFGINDLGKDKLKDKSIYQETSQEVEIPLSKPGEKGSLDVSSRNGRIKVIAYDGATVKVKMTKYEKKVSKSSSEGGMRLVSSGGFNFEASEYNNNVKVESNGWNDRIDFEIQVPKNFNIKADAYNNGHIDVEGVEGEFDIESYNGPITMLNVSGSVSANTYNGTIEVSFVKVTPDAPMAFSTYNGNVDITVPDGTKISTKMKTNRDIYTDFESFTIRDAKPITNKTNKGRFNVKYENWVEGSLNGGGAEVMLKTTNGNIYIRRK